MKDMSEGWKHGPFSKNIISYVHDCCDAPEKKSGRFHMPDPSREILKELVFLPANLSRVVIDAYREQCFTDASLGKRCEKHPVSLKAPLILMPPPQMPPQMKAVLFKAAGDTGIGYLGDCGSASPEVDSGGNYFTVLNDKLDPEKAGSAAAAFINLPESDNLAEFKEKIHTFREKTGKPVGLVTGGGFGKSARFAAEVGADMLFIDCGAPYAGVRFSSPAALTQAVYALRDLGKEDDVDLIVKGGFLDGTDVAKALAMGASAVVLSTGCEIALIEDADDEHDTEAALPEKIVNYINAVCSELEMISRACGKYYSASLEPEDMRALSLKTAGMTQIVLAGF